MESSRGFADDEADEEAREKNCEERQNSRRRQTEEREQVEILSVDKVTVEKIVVESANGSRELLVTKNETSKKLSVRSEKGRILRFARDERKESTNNGKCRTTVAQENSAPSKQSALFRSNIFRNGQSKLPVTRCKRSGGELKSANERRIKPIKLIKSPSIGSLVISGLQSANLSARRKKIPPEVPKKPTVKKASLRPLSEEASSKGEESNERNDASEVENFEKDVDEKLVKSAPANGSETKVDEEIDRNAADDKRSLDTDEKLEEKEKREKNVAEKSAQDCLEKSQWKIEDLQQNLRTRIHASTAKSYKEELLDLHANLSKFPVNRDPNLCEKVACSATFDQDFLEKHNLHKCLKIEERRLLETDLDYASDVEKSNECEEERPTVAAAKPRYSAKVTEVEKRWSGEFLEAQLRRDSSESSKSSYVEEFGSASSRESIVEERSCATKTFADERKFAEEGKRRTSEEFLEVSTVSTLDSDSCLEERIKAADEDIESLNNAAADFQRSFANDDVSSEKLKQQQKKKQKRAVIVGSITVDDDIVADKEEKLVGNSAATDLVADRRCAAVDEDKYEKIGERKEEKLIAYSAAVEAKPRLGETRVKDGYADLIKEFTMEAAASRGKKEEKQKKRLGLRRLLPGFFSPKDSRKDYKRKEQKERKKQDEQRHFARYQQNGNYMRSPDTMNLNEDIKRNVKLDASLNGSLIEERLDEIKRELFPDQGLITSTPDHFAQNDEQSLQDRGRSQRSYATDSSLSSIAPDEKWFGQNVQLGISPDVKRYEQRKNQEERENYRRFGHLERKHSLQESNHGGDRSYLFQRNHGPSGRISAPPSERFLVRPRAIHPVDRPLPAIPHSRVELSNYENYQDEGDNRCLLPRSAARCNEIETFHDADHPNASCFYENGQSGLILTSVSAQVKIRQPIINQNQRTPVIPRSPKYSSPGSSQKSGDYADSCCTPNSSQKSEFSPSSSKSGEYYLHSPRNSARTSPNERQFDGARCEEGIYENEAQRTTASHRYVDERVYDETPCEEKYSLDCKRLDSSFEQTKEKKNETSEMTSNERNSTPNSPSRAFASCNKDNKASPEKYALKNESSTLARNADARSPVKEAGKNVPPYSATQNGTPNSLSRASAPCRKAQPSDQILIASPKRETLFERGGARLSKDSRHPRPESPVPMTASPQHSSDVSLADSRKDSSTEKSSDCKRVASPSTLVPSVPCSPRNVQRPEPIYGTRKVQDKEISPTCNSKISQAIRPRNEGETSPKKSDAQQQQQQQHQRKQVEGSTNCEGNANVATREASPGGRVTQGCQIQGSAQATNSNPTSTSARPVLANSNQEKMYSSKNSPQREAPPQVCDAQRKQQQQSQVTSRDGRTLEAVYGQQCSNPTYGPMSPSKRQTMQHLEAFYWQQKALEAQRKASTPASVASVKQNYPKINLPEFREAVYWQQLKKLDEEQQRRIYERNLMDEAGYDAPSTSKNVATPRGQGQIRGPTAVDLPTRRTYWTHNKLERPKTSTPIKQSLMHGQKGSNQPVLIVRPQQALKERQEIPMKSMDTADVARLSPQRSKSASPHFHGAVDTVERRNLVIPRKSITRSANNATATATSAQSKGETSYSQEEEGNEIDNKPPPHPIFKRGSLVSGDSMEYGSSGPKRVSFSNQSVGTDVLAGSWPTKHGTAAEPPTRRHRNEDSSVSDTDSVFLRETNQDMLYGNANVYPRNGEQMYGARGRNERVSGSQDYDADRPLPPLPKESCALAVRSRGNLKGGANEESQWNVRRASSPNGNYSRRWPGACESESGSEAAGEVQRIFDRSREEEWNPDGKGRQSNDTGGSARGEGEIGSNELTPGRRGGGGGGGAGSGGGGGGGGADVLVGGGGSGGRGGGGRSRDEPRRHTLGGGDHQASLHHQQFNAAQQLHPLHPHHLPPPHGQYGTPPTRHTTMDLEMGTKSRQRKSPLPRGYPPPSSTMLFDDDPGIMSEVETSSTGFRRGGKQRSSLPVVRTPSKTLERPLGLVFLQYRNETKRALLPNEITSIDTVKALFVRSFPKQLTMEYLDSPHVKVYIHDSNKDMFYELEDLRSHLRDIRDRSVLRLFESTDGVTGMPGPLGIPGGGAGLPPHWEDQSYFSEPEFDSEYQHQHIHKSKTAKNSNSNSGGYYVGGSSTLPRGGPLLRAYSPAASSVVGGPNSTPTQPKALNTPGGGGVPPAKPLRSYPCGKSPLGSLGGSARFSRDSSVSLYSIPDRLHGESGYMSSPERGGGVGSATGRYPPGPYSAGSSYEDPYYSQYSGTVTPVIDEEASDTELLEESYSLYGVKPPGRPPSGPPRSPFPPGAPPPIPPGGQSYDATRIRVEHMERQLANLTGLVQKALTHAPHTSPSPRDYLQVPAGRDPYARTTGAGDEFDKHSSSSSASLPDDSYLRTDVKPPKLGKDKSVSFEKSVSFSDEPPDMNSPKQHSPQHAADTKPTKPAIKSSTLPRMSSQERDRHKPTPPPKPAALVAGQYVYRDLALTPEMYNQLRGLQKKAKDLRQEVRNLRRMSQAQAHTVRETIRDTFITIRAMLLSGGDAAWSAGDAEKIRLSREEDLYKQEMLRLEKDLTELESTVEELRGNVINRKTRVNMSDVENMALILSKSSKTVADLKVRFPSLQEGMKGLLSSEMEKVVREEKFLKEEPERLESALKRCKKLTGTLVTLKRLASVQEQRLPNAASVDAEETPPITPTSAQHSKYGWKWSTNFKEAIQTSHEHSCNLAERFETIPAATPVPAERTILGSTSVLGGGSHPHEPSATHQQRPENALDALLDELQTFSRPGSQMGQASSNVSGAGQPHQSSTCGAREVLGSTAMPPPASAGRAPCISDIGRKGSVDSSSGILATSNVVGLPGAPGSGGTLRRLHSYPSSSDTDTSPPIARLQVSSLQEQPGVPVLPQSFVAGQKPPVPERNAELLQLASARRVPPPPPPRTSSRSPLASPTSPQLPPRNHSYGGAQLNNCNSAVAAATLRRSAARAKEGKPPMALPPDALDIVDGRSSSHSNSAAIAVVNNHPSSSSSSSSCSQQALVVLSTSNSSSCESVNSQEGLQSKRDLHLDQRHQELLRKKKALQEQYARLQQLQRNTARLTTVPPVPPDLLKKTGSESNLLVKMGLGMSAANSGSLTSLSVKMAVAFQQQDGVNNHVDEANQTKHEDSTALPYRAADVSAPIANSSASDANPNASVTSSVVNSTITETTAATGTSTTGTLAIATSSSITSVATAASTTAVAATTTTTSKIYETDIL